MSTPTRPSSDEQRRPQADPELVDQLVETLQSIADERRYEQLLASSILDPVDSALRASQQQAFRDDRLVNRSLIAANTLVNRANTEIRARAREDVSRKDLQKRTEHYLHEVGKERQILKDIVRLLKLRRGIIDNSPNPKQRAMEDLWNLNMKQDVPKGTFRILLEEREEEVRAAKRAAKKQRAAERGPRTGEAVRAFTTGDVAAARARTEEQEPARRPTRRGTRAHR